MLHKPKNTKYERIFGFKQCFVVVFPSQLLNFARVYQYRGRVLVCMRILGCKGEGVIGVSEF